MKSNRKFGHQGDTALCGGFVDVHGQWNNGFHCPKWGPPDAQYCCGHDTHRFCCQPKPVQDSPPFYLKNLGFIVSILLGCVVLVVIISILLCYAYRCLCFKKRRKVSRMYSQSHSNNQRYYSRDFTQCSNHNDYTGTIPLGRMQNFNESPPPYPGEVEATSEEKVPLQSSLFETTNTGESPLRDNMAAVPLSLTLTGPNHPINQSDTCCSQSLPDLQNISSRQGQSNCPDILCNSYARDRQHFNVLKRECFSYDEQTNHPRSSMQSDTMRNRRNTENVDQLHSSDAKDPSKEIKEVGLEKREVVFPKAKRPQTLLVGLDNQRYHDDNTKESSTVDKPVVAKESSGGTVEKLTVVKESSTCTTAKGSSTADKPTVASLSPFEQDPSLDQIQNCANEQRQLYNMVIVGVEPDIPCVQTSITS